MINKWLILITVLMVGFVSGWYANSDKNDDVDNAFKGNTTDNAYTPSVLPDEQNHSFENCEEGENSGSLKPIAVTYSQDNTDEGTSRYSMAAPSEDSATEPLNNEERYQIQDYIADNNADGLSRHLAHAEAKVRAEVIEGFSIIADEASVRYLGQVLFSEPDASNRLKAVAMLEALTYYASAGHFLAVAKNNDPNEQVRKAATRAIGEG